MSKAYLFGCFVVEWFDETSPNIGIISLGWGLSRVLVRSVERLFYITIAVVLLFQITHLKEEPSQYEVS